MSLWSRECPVCADIGWCNDHPIKDHDDMTTKPNEPEALEPCRKGSKRQWYSPGKLRHGHARHGGKETPTYRSWQAMLSRCRYPERDADAKHINRGISVCSRWKLSFDDFLADMGERPEGTTLDRWPDNNGNYEPGNCRWATPREQARNTRNSKLNFDTAVAVAVARLNGEAAKSIAARYGISESLPREIVKGRTWPDALARAREIINER